MSHHNPDDAAPSRSDGSASSPGVTAVEIIGKGGIVTSLKVGGHTLAAETAILSLTARDGAVLTVDLPVTGGVVVTLDDSRTEVGAETHAALVAMGWLPPGTVVERETDEAFAARVGRALGSPAGRRAIRRERMRDGSQ